MKITEKEEGKKMEWRGEKEKRIKLKNTGKEKKERLWRWKKKKEKITEKENDLGRNTTKLNHKKDVDKKEKMQGEKKKTTGWQQANQNSNSGWNWIHFTLMITNQSLLTLWIK